MKIEPWVIEGVRQGLRDNSLTKEMLVKRRDELIEEGKKEGIEDNNFFKMVLEETNKRIEELS